MNTEQLIRPNILTLKPYSSAREEYLGAEALMLDANENPYGLWNRYPDPFQNQLKQKIATIKQLSPADLFLGNGSDEIIDLTFRIFCEPGVDKAICLGPTYGMYEVAAQINNISLIEIPLDTDFDIDLAQLDAYWERRDIKLLLLCSPNNPTGNLLSAASVRKILDQFKGIVLIDEAYIDFAATGSWALELPKYPNLIVLQTLSKAWAMAALRIGLAWMRPELLKYYNKVKPPYNISTANQEIALSLLNQSTFEQEINRLKEEQSWLIKTLTGMNGIKKVYPSSANFILVEVANANELYARLTAQKVVIRNRHSIIPNTLRLTVGRPEENRLFIQTLKTILNA